MVFPRWHDSSISPREAFFLSAGILLFCILRFWLALDMPIHPDEAYYWAWSVRPDLAYYDQGPGIAWYIKIFTFFLGQSYWVLKFAAIFAFFWVLYWTYGSARELGLGPHRSALAILGLALCPGVFSGSGLIMHDTVLLLFWTLALWAMLRYLLRRQVRYLYLMFLAVGLGALGKHTMALFALSLVFWYFTQRQEYYLLRYRHFWGGVLVTLFCLTPLWIWNFRHNWDQVGAILHLRSSGGEFAKGNPLEMIVGQMGLLSPIWFLCFVFLSFFIAWKLVRRISLIRFKPDTRELGLWDALLVSERSLRLRVLRWVMDGRLRPDQLSDPHAERELNRRSAFWLVFWNAIFLPLFFLILSRTRNVQANWVMPSYPAIFILLAAYIPAGKAKVDVRLRTRKLYMGALALGLLFVVLLNLYVFRGKALMEWIGLRPPAYALLEYRTRGYEEVIKEIQELRTKRDPAARLIANRYQDAAIAHWYLRKSEQPFVASMNISQKNQYSYWPSLQKGKNYFCFAIVDNAEESVDRGLTIWLPYMFEKVEELPERVVSIDGMPVKRYRVWYAQNFRVEWYEILKVYLDRIAILDLMPSMRGFDKNLKARGAVEQMAHFLKANQSRQACRKQSIWEKFLRAFLGTGRLCKEGK